MQIETKLYYFLICLLVSCTSGRKDINDPNYNPYILKTGKQIHAEGRVIKLDTLEKPVFVPARGNTIKTGKPIIIPIQSNSRLMGSPKKISIRGEVVNMDTVAKPQYFPTVGEKVTTSWPKWTAAKATFKDENPYMFSYLDLEQGLNSDYVYALLEDRFGNIWIATWGGGVSMWDGNGLITFGPNEGLASSVVNLLEDKKGNIWMTTYGAGLFMWDGESFTRFTEEDGLANNSTWSLLEDRNGNIWVGTTGGGISVWDGKGFTNYGKREGLINEIVPGLAEDIDGNIWIATLGGLVKWEINRSNGEGTFINFTVKEGFPGTQPWDIYRDSRGNIWVAATNGLVVLNPAEVDTRGQFQLFTEDEGLVGNRILSIMEDDQDRIWIGTSQGLNVWEVDSTSRDGTVGKLYHYTREEGVSNNRISSIIQDRSKRIWVGTDGGGINILGKNQFEHFVQNGELGTSTIFNILEASDGKIWLGTLGGGVSIWDKGYFYRYPQIVSLSQSEIWSSSVIEDKRGNVWIGTRGYGLFVWHPHELIKGGTVTHYSEKDGLTSNDIAGLLEDRNGNIWVGTFNNGINICTLDEEGRVKGFYQHTQITQLAGINGSIFVLYEDHLGRIWIATNGSGIAIWEDATFTYFPGDEELGIRRSNSLIEDEFGDLWITSTNGLFRWDGEVFTKYTQSEGLTHNFANSLLRDNHGNIWLGTPKGLDLLSKGTQESNWVLKHFGRPEGMASTSVQTSILDREGRMLIATSNGFSRLNSNVLQSDSFPPQLAMLDFQPVLDFVDWRQADTELQSNGQSITKERHISLESVSIDSVYRRSNLPVNPSFPYHFNDFTLRWTAHHADQHKLQYSYVLERDKRRSEWSPLVQQNSVDFRNLRHGNYRFKVRAVAGNGLWSETKAYTFEIRPPWWLSWWAYVIYFVAILAVLSAIYLYQRRRWQLQTQLQLEQEKAHRFKELDNFKSRFYTNITHEFRTPLTVIKGMATQIEENEKIKTLIQRNSHRLLNMVNQLLDLSKLETNSLTIDWVQGDIISYLKYLTESCHSLAANKHLNLAFFSTQERLMMDYDENKLQQILINLLSNAIKFTPAYGSVKVIANRTEDAHVELIVSDTGKGIAEDKLPHIFNRFYQVDGSSMRSGEGSGIGLALVKELVELLQGRIEVSSKIDKGSEFKVYLPIYQRAESASFESSMAEHELSLVGIETVDTSSLTLTNGSEEKPLVLIIEDNADVSEYIFSCLKQDYALQAAKNGKEGVEKALEIIPDVILCDVMMPEMDGFEVCQRLKSDKLTSHIPIVMLTAKATQEDKVAGLSYGADAYLTKPFDKEELLVRLRNLALLSKRLQQKLIDSTPSGEEPSPLEKQEAAFLKEVNEIITSNLANELFNTNQLCRAIGMSRTQLHRKLKALTNQSTANYIRTVRLKKAKALLQTTDQPIGDIAIQVGFKDFSHFSRMFLKEFGVQPSRMRDA